MIEFDSHLQNNLFVLQLNNVENIPPKEIDESMLFLDEKKNKVE